MPRTKGEILYDISELEDGRDSLNIEQCIYCLKHCKGEKKIKNYEIHNDCYKKIPADPRPGTLEFYLQELEEL